MTHPLILSTRKTSRNLGTLRLNQCSTLLKADRPRPRTAQTTRTPRPETTPTLHLPNNLRSRDPCFVNDPVLTHHLQGAPTTREMGVTRTLAGFATLDSNKDQSGIQTLLRDSLMTTVSNRQSQSTTAKTLLVKRKVKEERLRRFTLPFQ